MELKFIHHTVKDVYYFDLNGLSDSRAMEIRLKAKILKLYRENRTLEKLKPITYEWGRPRKSWQDTRKPVFIDFGEDDLVWIKSNLGAKYGHGFKVSKKDFFAKYA